MEKLLIVDDNDVSRELIREVLEAPGREILEAGHGRAGLESLERHAPALVLLDLQMPGWDGFEILRRIRADARWRRVRVLALTASAMQGDRERALAAGFDDYITKPIDAALLRRKVEEFLASS